jgi:shikimate dehydrogenase
LNLSGQRVLLLGAGGAARGVLQPLLDEHPSNLLIANRTEANALRLVAEVAPAISSVAAVSLTALAGEHFDVIINASAAGLDVAGSSPINSVSPAPTSEFAYDMMYGRETEFMAQARAQGMRVADGLGMLIEQAAESFYLWRGIRPDTKPVMAALRAELGKSH